MIRTILFYLVLFSAGYYLLNQARRPTRWAGRIYLWMMNISHSALTDWGLQQSTIEKHFTILDVGCGGGRTIQKLAGATEGMVYGVDYAKGSVHASRATNAKMVKSGRVKILRASVSQLPFKDNQFDCVTAVETHYYWPDVANDMREILRILKPGGTLILIAESYRNSKNDWWQRPVMTLLRSTQLSKVEHQEMFARAGYTDVQVVADHNKGWLCGTGRKAHSEF